MYKPQVVTCDTFATSFRTFAVPYKALALSILAGGLTTPALVSASDGDPWEGEVELGALVTKGNSEETNLNGRIALGYEVEHWRNTAEFFSLYSEANSETSAEEYRAQLESNYKLNERQYLFARGSYEDDRFSGYDYESSATAGYGHRVWARGDDSFLDFTAGAGYRYNRLAEEDESGDRYEKARIIRLAGQLDFEISDNAFFREKLSTEIGIDDSNTKTVSETSLQSYIYSTLAMKVSYRLEHQSSPPADSKSIKSETSLSLVYGF